MDKSGLYRRLRNWGHWLNYEADIGPKGARCISIESRHMPDAGDVWEPDEPEIIPDVPDAEAINILIRELDTVEQYALSVRYGGMPCVIRWRRMSGAVHDKLADNAEILLCEMLRKSA